MSRLKGNGSKGLMPLPGRYSARSRPRTTSGGATAKTAVPAAPVTTPASRSLDERARAALPRAWRSVERPRRSANHRSNHGQRSPSRLQHVFPGLLGPRGAIAVLTSFSSSGGGITAGSPRTESRTRGTIRSCGTGVYLLLATSISCSGSGDVGLGLHHTFAGHQARRLPAARLTSPPGALGLGVEAEGAEDPAHHLSVSRPWYNSSLLFDGAPLLGVRQIVFVVVLLLLDLIVIDLFGDRGSRWWAPDTSSAGSTGSRGSIAAPIACSCRELSRRLTRLLRLRP